jgi:hypothetical protein
MSFVVKNFAFSFVFQMERLLGNFDMASDQVVGDSAAVVLGWKRIFANGSPVLYISMPGEQERRVQYK